MIPQQLLANKTQELPQIPSGLLTRVEHALERHTPIHEVEREAFDILLWAGRVAVQGLVDCHGYGDLGGEYQLPNGAVCQRSAEPQQCTYVTMFGELHMERYVYPQRQGHAIHVEAIAARLTLPRGNVSYLLRDWNHHLAMEQPFGGVSQAWARILGLEQHVDTLERMNRQMGDSLEGGEGALPTPPAEEKGEVLVPTVDEKGVPIGRLAEASAIASDEHQPDFKTDRERMATIGVVSTIDRFPCIPQEVVEALFQDPRVGAGEKELGARLRARPCHKRMRAAFAHLESEGEEVAGGRRCSAGATSRSPHATPAANPWCGI